MNYSLNNATINSVVDKLSQPQSYEGLYHHNPEGQALPSEQAVREFIALVRSTIFPGYYSSSSLHDSTITYHLGVAVERMHRVLAKQILYSLCFAEQEICKGESCNSEQEYKALNIAGTFISYLPELRRMLALDVEAAYQGDPAAESIGEIICCYPSLKAITYHRIAHKLYELQVPLLPRIISEIAHSETGIDIHPAARIGESFFIDHGTGVVIGATCIIGSRVKLYQGVTLGAKSFPKADDGSLIKGIERHPIIGDNVIVYSNTTLLGRINIGESARIGANMWITEDVPAGQSLSRPL
ncbi:MAG: serine acetyltransferase [Porphyromonas sp.]|nr:serine acetyltransferase [Porphyromonas sp.]